MIDTLTVESFKSLEHVSVQLGRVNVFIGANGSGKSNLLEALGVLSAAAEGKVTDQALLQRGVRPGVPRLYKSAFQQRLKARRAPSHIFFSATNGAGRYEVSLHNPLDDPSPAWRYKTELWEYNEQKIVGRSPASRKEFHPEQGLAALEAVTRKEGDPAFEFIRAIQGYAIYTPTTAVLRGISPELQTRAPVGLSGGHLPNAVDELMYESFDSEFIDKVWDETVELIPWARWFGAAAASSIPLSPAAAASPQVVYFVDRYMPRKKNRLSGYDASEGALYVLFLAIIAAHPQSPQVCAVDNADHGLNPRLACDLMRRLCRWYIDSPAPRQLLITTHNPLILDGLLLQDDRVRLFVVSRSDSGRTLIRRIEFDDTLLEKARQGWTLSRLWVMGHLGGLPNVF